MTGHRPIVTSAGRRRCRTMFGGYRTAWPGLPDYAWFARSAESGSARPSVRLALDEQRLVDRRVAHPHLRVVGMHCRQRQVICWGQPAAARGSAGPAGGRRRWFPGKLGRSRTAGPTGWAAPSASMRSIAASATRSRATSRDDGRGRAAEARRDPSQRFAGRAGPG